MPIMAFKTWVREGSPLEQGLRPGSTRVGHLEGVRHVFLKRDLVYE